MNVFSALQRCSTSSTGGYKSTVLSLQFLVRRKRSFQKAPENNKLVSIFLSEGLIFIIPSTGFWIKKKIIKIKGGGGVKKKSTVNYRL